MRAAVHAPEAVLGERRHVGKFGMALPTRATAIMRSLPAFRLRHADAGSKVRSMTPPRVLIHGGGAPFVGTWFSSPADFRALKDSWIAICAMVPVAGVAMRLSLPD